MQPSHEEIIRQSRQAERVAKAELARLKVESIQATLVSRDTLAGLIATVEAAAREELNALAVTLAEMVWSEQGNGMVREEVDLILADLSAALARVIDDATADTQETFTI